MQHSTGAVLKRRVRFTHASFFDLQKEVMLMARRKKRSSIKLEIESLVREKVDQSYIERLGGVFDSGLGADVSVCRAIAMAQVKKGLEGDLKAAEFIEDILTDCKQDSGDSPFELVLKVVGEPEAKHGA